MRVHLWLTATAVLTAAFSSPATGETRESAPAQGALLASREQQETELQETARTLLSSFKRLDHPTGEIRVESRPLVHALEEVVKEKRWTPPSPPRILNIYFSAFLPLPNEYDFSAFTQRLCTPFSPLSPSYRTWHFSARVHAHLGHYIERFVYPKGFLREAADKELLAACKSAFEALDKLLFPWIPRSRDDSISWKSRVSGRGIVMLVGDNYWKIASVMIHSLRTIHKSKLPVRVYYLSNQDLSLAHRQALEQLPGVKVFNLAEQFGKEVELSGYNAKPFALLASGFAEAVFIDADIVFWQPPGLLFDLLEYQETGVVMFLDRNIPIAGTNLEWVRRLVGPGSSFLQSSRLFKKTSNHEVESGVLVVNVARNLWPLLIAAKLNTGPDKEDTNSHTLGDKETYWLGFEIAQLRWAVNPGDVAGLSFCKHAQEANNTCYCNPKGDLQGLDSPGILHTGAQGEFIFLHFSLQKYAPWDAEPSLYTPGTLKPWYIEDTRAGKGRYCVWGKREDIRPVPPAMLEVFREHVALSAKLEAQERSLGQA